MNVKKFTAATSRDALRKVREALGPDAVILSNRPVDGIVEILALANDDVASMASPSPDRMPHARLMAMVRELHQAGYQKLYLYYSPAGKALARVRRISCFCPGAMVTTGGLPTTSRWFWYLSSKPS